MRQTTVKIYDFRELSEAAKTRAINDAREEAAEAEIACLEDDFGNALQCICDVFGIEIRDYIIGGYNTFFCFDVDGGMNDEDPRLFSRWINRVLSRIEESKVYSINGKRRASKITKTIEDLPFSGCWLDEKPEEVLRRYADYIKAGRTIHDFCDDILMALANSYNDYAEYAYSDEAIEDFIENNDFSFTENGERFACVA